MKKTKAIAVVLTIALTANAYGAGWVVNKSIGRDPKAPAIAKPRILNMELTDDSKVKIAGLGKETAACVYAAFRVEADVTLIEHIRVDFAVLLQSPNGNVYVKRGYAYRPRERIESINQMRTDKIHGFKVNPYTKLLGYRIALFCSNVAYDEKAWTAKSAIESGYGNQWFKR